MHVCLPEQRLRKPFLWSVVSLLTFGKVNTTRMWQPGLQKKPCAEKIKTKNNHRIIFPHWPSRRSKNRTCVPTWSAKKKHRTEKNRPICISDRFLGTFLLKWRFLLFCFFHANGKKHMTFWEGQKGHRFAHLATKKKPYPPLLLSSPWRRTFRPKHGVLGFSKFSFFEILKFFFAFEKNVENDTHT